MSGPRTFLVAGATGQQGGAVARSLSRRGHRVRGLTRREEGVAELQALGIEGVRGDLTDRAGLASPLRGVDGFFLVTTPFRPDFSLDVDAEIRQGVTSIDAAKAAGVPHVVLSSVASADEDTGIPHFESKAEVERHLKGSGLRHTIVRPVAFMETYAGWWMGSAMEAGLLALPLPEAYRLQMISVRDIGEVVRLAFERPEWASGRTLEIAGDEVSMGDLVGRFSRKLGRPVRYAEVPDEEVVKTMGEDGARMFRWFREKGFHVDIAALESDTGHRMTRFEAFFETMAPGG